MGDRERIREDVRESEFKNVLENLDQLGEVYDQMDLETKKKHALSMYYQLLKVSVSCVTIKSLNK